MNRRPASRLAPSRREASEDPTRKRALNFLAVQVMGGSLWGVGTWRGKVFLGGENAMVLRVE